MGVRSHKFFSIVSCCVHLQQRYMTAAVKSLSSSGTDVLQKQAQRLASTQMHATCYLSKVCSVTAKSTTRIAQSLNSGVLIMRIQVIYWQNIMFQRSLNVRNSHNFFLKFHFLVYQENTKRARQKSSWLGRYERIFCIWVNI